MSSTLISSSTARSRGRVGARLGAILAVVAGLMFAALPAAPASAETFRNLAHLSASTSYAVLGRAVTLTATASSDVGPTPYYLQIFDQSTGARVVACGSGTVCTANVSYSYSTTHNYVAYIAGLGSYNPPPNIEDTSSPVSVTWRATLALNGPSGYVYGGNAVTIPAYAAYDVGPTPYYIEIFNQSTGVRVAACGAGSSCSASVTGYSPQTFVAYISSWGTGNPPPNVQATSNPFTVNWISIH